MLIHIAKICKNKIQLVNLQWIQEHKQLWINWYKWMKRRKIYSGRDQEVIHCLIFNTSTQMTYLMLIVTKIQKMNKKKVLMYSSKKGISVMKFKNILCSKKSWKKERWSWWMVRQNKMNKNRIRMKMTLNKQNLLNNKNLKSKVLSLVKI